MKLKYYKTFKILLVVIFLSFIAGVCFSKVKAITYDYDPYNQKINAPESYYTLLNRDITTFLPTEFKDRTEIIMGVKTSLSYNITNLYVATSNNNIFMALNLEEDAQSEASFTHNKCLLILVITYNLTIKQYELKNHFSSKTDANIPKEALALAFSEHKLYLSSNVVRLLYNYDIINPIDKKVLIKVDSLVSDDTLAIEKQLLKDLEQEVKNDNYPKEEYDKYKYNLEQSKRQEYPIYMYDFTSEDYKLTFDRTFGLKASEAHILDENYKTPFKPVRIATNPQHNILYVISEGSKLGLLGFDRHDGTFIKFVGSNKIELSLAEKFWRKLANKNLLDQKDKKVQENFSDLAVDENGFIYTATATSKNTPIQRFNAKGENILKSKHKSITGDYKKANEKGHKQSKLSLIDVSTYGTFITYDKENGRIFSYNNNGELLFVYGKKGSSKENFSDVQTMRFLGDNIVLTDRKGSSSFYLKIITPTKYGDLINLSSKNYASGDYDKSYELFNEMIKYNSNSYYAHIGLGKIYYLRGDYKNACREYKLGHSKSGYAEAYEIYRNNVIKESIFLISAIIVFAIVFNVSLKKFIKDKKRKK